MDFPKCAHGAYISPAFVTLKSNTIPGIPLLIPIFPVLWEPGPSGAIRPHRHPMGPVLSFGMAWLLFLIVFVIVPVLVAIKDAGLWDLPRIKREREEKRDRWSDYSRRW